MKICPTCGRKGRTLETRSDALATTRRYRCTEMHRWATVELHVPDEVREGKAVGLHDRVIQWLARGAPV